MTNPVNKVLLETQEFQVEISRLKSLVEFQAKALELTEKHRQDQMTYYVSYIAQLLAEVEELKTGAESPIKCKCEACEEARNGR